MNKLYEENTVKVILPEWLAERRGTEQKLVGYCKKETKKAILLQIEGEELWLPKSEIEIQL